MKNDIDLLGGYSEGTKKKSSNSMTLIVGVLVLALVGVMLFLFFSAQGEVKDKENTIKELDVKLQQEVTIAGLEQQLANKKQEYSNKIGEVMKSIHAGLLPDVGTEVGDEIFDVIFTNYISKVSGGLDEKGEEVVSIQINGFNVDTGKISFSCATRSYEEAWAFTEYLMGTLEIVEPEGIGAPLPVKPAQPAPLPDKATEDEKKAYETAMEEYNEAMKVYQNEVTNYNKGQFAVNLYNHFKDKPELISNNAKYFSGVEASYPGLPVEGDGKEYSITFSLSFDIDWEELAA